MLHAFPNHLNNVYGFYSLIDSLCSSMSREVREETRQREQDSAKLTVEAFASPIPPGGWLNLSSPEGCIE